MAKYLKTEQGYIDASIFAPAPFKPEGKSYLTFSSPKSFTLKVNNATKNWDGTLEYFSADKVWTVWDGTTILFADNNDGEYVLYLRGTGNTKITGLNANGSSDTYRWVLTGSDIACVGNIENLLDYATVESGQHPTMAEACYVYMFYDCTSLTQAPALPATTLAKYCYCQMFIRCTSLTQAPVLPAITLSYGCYQDMFFGCTSLTQAPTLTATTLADYCYADMFYNCTSLTQAPALPATTLANYCYYQMFSGCTSLTQAPALPATTLADDCYYYMFNRCTSLTKAPELPATTLATKCYQGMFARCTSLTQAPALPATTLADDCYYYMFDRCTSLTKAPELPATTLATKCYYGMFVRCTSLTQAPALPATTLANYCYADMFKGCTALKLSNTKTGEYTQEYRIPSSGTGTTASNALTNMFFSTGGTLSASPSINTTYYLSTDNMIVRETEVATLNGYVGSMIDDSVSNPLNITSATVGQIAKITAVDDSGKPTAWVAVDMPTSLPNPNALTLTGAVTGSYDGSEPLTVEIPSGGSGGTDISLGLTSASVGQTIKVKAVDENGKPTAWEAADMAGGESSFPKFEKLLTHTITEEEIAANPVAFVWGTAQIPNLNDFNVFTLTIRNPDDTTKITFTKWVRLKINNVLIGNICGTNQGEGYKYSISANRLYGFWVSDNMYNPNNDSTNVLTPPYSRQGFDSNLAASEAVTSIGFTSYAPDYGLTAGIIVEIWGAK